MKNFILTMMFIVTSSVSAQTETNTKINQGSHGMVSWYGKQYHGRKMANSKPFNMYSLTCAATSEYALGERLRVTNVKNGKSVVVVVTDRGPFGKIGRSLDLSYAAFKEIASTKSGVIKTKIERL